MMSSIATKAGSSVVFFMSLRKNFLPFFSSADFL